MLRALFAWLVGTALAGGALLPSVARADPASDAKDLFTQGRELRSKGDCGAAAALFRKALDVYPAGLGSLRNLAECEEQLGHFASSRRAWLDLKRALVTEDARKYDGWDKDADAAAARLSPKLARLTVDLKVVDNEGKPADAREVDVALDGEPLPAALVGTALERDPGRHVAKVSGARVKSPVERAVTVAAGETQHIALQVVVEAAPPVAPSPVAPAAPTGPSPLETAAPADDGRALRRTLGWVAVGVGGALVIGAGVSLGVRQSALDQVNGSCPGHSGCDPSLRSTASRGQTASLLFDVLGPAGVASLAGGLALVLTSGRSPTAAPAASLTVTPHLGGATATWSF